MARKLSTNYKVNNFFTVKSSYSLLRTALHSTTGAPLASEAVENRSPQHQFYTGSFLTLPKSFEVSSHVYVVGPLRDFRIPTHTRFDLNVAWKRFENLELSAAAQNLLGSHTEYGVTVGPVNVIRPSIYGKIKWKF
jgi:outer membrane receptor protein involved in Fe transport